MKVLRTPEENFADLPDYAFAENYVNVSDTEGGELRMHYLDEDQPKRIPYYFYMVNHLGVTFTDT